MAYREYDLSLINKNKTHDLFNEIKNNTMKNLPLIHKNWIKNDKIYNILKYDKQFLTHDMINDIGIWRSVVYSNDKINVFSPPKSLNINIFMNTYNESECTAEEFIEGTMINLFYDEDIKDWEITSKSSVGGNVTFFQDQPTFSDLFYEICKELDININNFSKEYSYSFVIQHPQNKFVIPIKEKKLYLIAMYKIDNDILKVTEILHSTRLSIGSPIASLNNDILSKLSFPNIYNFSSYYELAKNYASMETNINTMGVVIYHTDGTRTKMRNPNYEYLKQLRGNNTKLQYQYLCLRKLNNVKEYVRYFPQNRTQLNVFRSQLHLLTDQLYQNYISCYIRKDKPLKEFSSQFRTHMYNLHQHYLTIRGDKGFINRTIVIKYINNLEPAKLMYTLNYHLHRVGKQIDIMEKNSSNENGIVV